MSHQVKVQTQIKDKKILLETLTELGYSYTENGMLVDYRDNNLENVSILVKIGYKSNRVGFKYDSNTESYDLVGDFYSLNTNETDFRNSIKKTYVSKQVENLLRKKRYTVTDQSTTNKGGILILARQIAA